MLALRFTRSRRATRAICAALALALAAGNACAVLGVCVAKATPAAVASEVQCDHHGNGESSTGGPAGSAHCPQEDSGLQARSADLPAGSVIGVAEVPWANPLPAGGIERAITVERASAKPLYARLSRLLL